MPAASAMLRHDLHAYSRLTDFFASMGDGNSQTSPVNSATACALDNAGMRSECNGFRYVYAILSTSARQRTVRLSRSMSSRWESLRPAVALLFNVGARPPHGRRRSIANAESTWIHSGHAPSSIASRVRAVAASRRPKSAATLAL